MTQEKKPLSERFFKQDPKMKAPRKTKKKTKRTSLYVILIFIIVQLSPVLFVAPTYDYFLGQGMDAATAEAVTTGWLIFLAMGIGFIITLIVVFRDRQFFDIWKGKKAGIGMSILWGLGGFLLLLIGQSLAAMIEMALGIEPGSENTSSLVDVAEVVPAAIFAVVLFGPVLEELLFRRVIFGSLNQKTNFFIATAISALVFALVHFEFIHLLLYLTTGLILAFLYQQTKRIITPIIAHVCLNGYVMLIQLNMDKIEQFLKQMENMQ